MNIRKVIQRRIRHTGPGVDVVSDINAVVSANVGERSVPASTRRNATSKTPAATDEAEQKEDER